jgi:hypothetical protein
MLIHQNQITITVSKPGQASTGQQGRIAKRADCPIYQAARFVSKDATKLMAFQVQDLAALSSIKYQEYALLIIWPN